MADLEAKMDTVLSRLTSVDSVLGKINARITSIDTRFADFDVRLNNRQCEVSGIRADFTSQKKEIGEIRNEVCVLQANVGFNTNKLAEHDTGLDAVRAKLADIEDRSRRGNVRINALPEGREGGRDLVPSSFLLKTCRSGSSLSNVQGEIMRVHRINGTGALNMTGRTLIFCCLRYTVRQDNLAAARKNAKPGPAASSSF